MVLEVRDIALAAFMKMNGCKVLGYDGRKFHMESTVAKPIEEWSLSYTNSCCCTHDAQLLQLRGMVRRYKS